MEEDFAVVHMKESAAATTSRYDSTEAQNLKGIGRGSGGGNCGGGSKRRCRNAKGGILLSSQTTLSTTATSVMKQAQRRRMRSASPLQSMGAGVRGGEECAAMSSGNNPPITRRVASMSPPNSARKIDRDRNTKRIQMPKNIMRAGEQVNRLPSWWAKSKSVALSTRMLGSGHISGGNRGKGNKTTSATDIVTQGEKGGDEKDGGKEGEWDGVKQTARSVDHEQNRIVQVPTNLIFESLSEDEIISQAIQNLRRIRELGGEVAAEVRMEGGQQRCPCLFSRVYKCTCARTHMHRYAHAHRQCMACSHRLRRTDSLGASFSVMFLCEQGEDEGGERDGVVKKAERRPTECGR